MKRYTKHIIEAFGRDDGPDIMIVVDKLLTGFDEPKTPCSILISRSNSITSFRRLLGLTALYQKKQFGYLIDYRGILTELDATIADYQELAERTLGGFDIDDPKGYTLAWILSTKAARSLQSLMAIFDGAEEARRTSLASTGFGTEN